MTTNLPPRHPEENDHASRQDDRVTRQTPAAPTDPAGQTRPAVDDAATEQPEWYPPPDTPCM
jgi:hypothetical protein